MSFDKCTYMYHPNSYHNVKYDLNPEVPSCPFSVFLALGEILFPLILSIFSTIVWLDYFRTSYNWEHVVYIFVFTGTVCLRFIHIVYISSFFVGVLPLYAYIAVCSVECRLSCFQILAISLLWKLACKSLGVHMFPFFLE